MTQTSTGAPAAQSVAPYLPIHFVTVNLNETVHCQALGFTKQFYLYACASNEAEAELVARAWCVERGLDVKNTKAMAGGNQQISRYTFPEQIINMPQKILDAEYDRRQYPDDWRAKARIVKIPEATP